MTSIIVRYGEIHSYLREEARPVRLYLDTSSLHIARLNLFHFEIFHHIRFKINVRTLRMVVIFSGVTATSSSARMRAA